MDNRILLVDDEKEYCVSLKKLFDAHGMKCDYCMDPVSAIEMFRQSSYELVICDLKMPRMSGIDLLQRIREYNPHVAIIMISGYASTDSVVEAMRCGALNFYEKPVPFPKLLEEIRKILDRRSVDASLNATDVEGVGTIITVNERMKHLIHIARKAATTDAPVIVTGKSGTGKELFSSIIHECSNRKDGPFIKMNCAAIPENLLESELFGYEKGAFTDAKKDQKGKFEVADGGTMFFDEIGDMSLQTQAKLLRVLQEGEFERLGSHHTRKVDVRFVAATNQDIQEKIQEGSFREDLFFRLSVIQLEIPSLSERPDDIIPLARYYLDEFNHKYHKQVKGFSDEVMNMLLLHSWPGNVRELKNCVERAVIFCETDEITRDVIPDHYQRECVKEESPPLQSFYDSVSREMILNALDKVQGSRTKAAELLNISRKTLYSRMKKLGINV
jgi:DNA-binding NtrC family response regulator